jgi:hypothetical protein
MVEFIVQAILLLCILFFGSQLALFICLLCWCIYKDAIEPRMVPQSEINEIADSIIESFDDPERTAYLRGQAAWYESDIGGHIYWRRVGKAVEKRRTARNTDKERKKR